MREKELYDRSLDLWGLSSQIAMLSEEACELSLAAHHLNRALKNKTESLNELAEEIADVQFMIDEFLYYFTNHPQLSNLPYLQGESMVTKVARYRKVKRERLMEILKGRF